MADGLILEASRSRAASLAWSSATHVGHLRATNEDALLAEAPVFLVADGMGGHQAGDVASALVISRFRPLADGEVADVDAVAAEARTVNAMLRDTGRSMGTTAAGLMVVEHRGIISWLVLNIGDSRVYCYTSDGLRQITEDHSYVQQLVDAGEITAAEAARHPRRNVITRALGAADEAAVDYWLRPIRAGERYLICSDGLHGEISDDLIAEVLSIGLTPDETVDALLHHALDAGGRDNVTAVVIDVLRDLTAVAATTNPRRVSTWTTDPVARRALDPATGHQPEESP